MTLSTVFALKKADMGFINNILSSFKKSKNELTDSSKFMIEGEMTAILLVGLYVLIFKEFNWY
ncbi:hypothetical protein [Aestuariivivens sediminis]|uniref:hypothetical protein n=1 Tax=Aestuariivivens sediminis TaxID=2913557 RepID=UPI001F5A9BE9|nr:hypothetical protein [Aestuariivivens sediminis]